MRDKIPKRSLEVLKFACLTNPEIAKKLGISRVTVATHFEIIRGVFGGKTKAELLIRALKQGCINLEDVVLDPP